MNLRIDHVTVAGQDLETLSDAFTRAGLPAEYGGTHSNDVTHMSVVGFRDGSYIELISAFDEDATSPWWHDPIHKDGGTCAWAVRTDDISTLSERIRDRGFAVDGPHEYRREREDGTLVEWKLTSLGDGDPGQTLPFVIEDTTPRERRVTPTGTLAESSITGVERVLLVVPDISNAIDRFRRAFDLGSPRRSSAENLQADVAVFPKTPVILLEPTARGWLQERLDRFGPRPAGYLLGKPAGTEPPFDVVRTGEIAERRVEWISVAAPVGRPYLGVVEVE